jgi:uncharacterized protein YjbI with pentapeptide repeats
MDSFFTGANLTWIIGIISSIAAGLSALSKFRYQNKLELFKETNVNIFKQEKEEVLAAISTMSVFKKDSRFEKHTTNVLLSRLYTELDYDITNAICGALIQYSNRGELLDISSEVLNINRNFFVQTSPVNQMISDLDRSWSALNAESSGTKDDSDKNASGETKDNLQGSAEKETDLSKQPKQSATESLGNLEKAMSKELLDNYKQRSLTWLPKKRYELLWHKQITADTYSRILRRAYYSQPSGWNRMRQKFYRLIRAKGKYNRFKELDMDFYQNDFNYVYMADFNTSSCSIVRSAMGSAVIVDVGFLNIGRISGSSFLESALHNCRFRGGVAESDTKFTNCKFYKGSFENIHLKEVDFYGATHDGVIFDGENLRNMFVLKMDHCSFNYSSFTNCVFRNCFISFSSFASCLFENVLFENVMFKETYLCNSNFVRTSFINCSGLESQHFYKYYHLGPDTKLPSQVSQADIDRLESAATEKYILDRDLTTNDKTYLQSIFTSLKK